MYSVNGSNHLYFTCEYCDDSEVEPVELQIDSDGDKDFGPSDFLNNSSRFKFFSMFKMLRIIY